MDVVLASGARIRGRIEELVPGDHCRVRGKDGAARTIPWREIVRIVPPGAVVETPPAPSEAPALAPAPPRSPPPPSAAEAEPAPPAATTTAPPPSRDRGKTVRV